MSSRQRLPHWQQKKNDDDDDVKLMMTRWIVTRCVRNVYSLSSICVRILLQKRTLTFIRNDLDEFPLSLIILRFNITKPKSKLRSFKWGTSSSLTLSSTFFFFSLVLMSFGCLLTVFFFSVCC